MELVKASDVPYWHDPWAEMEWAGLKQNLEISHSSAAWAGTCLTKPAGIVCWNGPGRCLFPPQGRHSLGVVVRGVGPGGPSLPVPLGMAGLVGPCWPNPEMVLPPPLPAQPRRQLWKPSGYLIIEPVLVVSHTCSVEFFPQKKQPPQATQWESQIYDDGWPCGHVKWGMTNKTCWNMARAH